MIPILVDKDGNQLRVLGNLPAGTLPRVGEHVNLENEELVVFRVRWDFRVEMNEIQVFVKPVPNAQGF